MNRISVVVSGLFVLVFAATGCATTTPYISNELGARIATTSSPFHEFTYVRAYEDDGELVVYGKLRHNHVICEREGHVDLAIEDARRNTVYTASLPMRRQSNRQHGWYGAGFRMRVPLKSRASVLRFAFHDPGCHGVSFDCDSNAAAATRVVGTR